LKPTGVVLIKTTQGAGPEELVDPALETSTTVHFAISEPPRPRSSELYLLASGFGMV